MVKENDRRIPVLDGLRAIAIALVMLSHGFLLSDTSTRFARGFSYGLGYLGGLGVSLFFAISGYLITTLLLREQLARGSISLKGFYIRRALRILPPAYLYLLVLLLSGVALRPGEVWSAALFFNNYWPERGWFTQHFWSLSMEEHFYLLWPAVLALGGVQAAGRLAGVTITAMAFWRPWSLLHVTLSVPAWQRTDMRLDAFLFAGLLAIVMQGSCRERVLAVLSARWFRASSILVLISIGAWSVAGAVSALGMSAQSALLPLILVSLIHCGERPYWQRILESPPLRWMGKISYGLYLWQQYFLIGHSQATLLAALEAFLPRLILIFAIAACSYYVLERHLLDLGKRISERIRAPSHAPVWRTAMDPLSTTSSSISSSIMEP